MDDHQITGLVLRHKLMKFPRRGLCEMHNRTFNRSHYVVGKWSAGVLRKPENRVFAVTIVLWVGRCCVGSGDMHQPRPYVAKKLARSRMGDLFDAIPNKNGVRD